MKNYIFFFGAFLTMACSNQDPVKGNRKSVNHDSHSNCGKIQPASEAVLVSMKNNLGVDTVFAILGEYSSKHDLLLWIRVHSELKRTLTWQKRCGDDTTRISSILRQGEISKNDKLSPPVKETQLKLSRQFKMRVEVIGEIVYNYVLLSKECRSGE